MIASNPKRSSIGERGVGEARQTGPSDGWRVVVFTNIPGGVVYHAIEAVLRPLGHRVVGIVTLPGPKRRHSDAYLDVVAAAPPAVDVIVTNHPARLAAMLAPLRPDLIISGGFPWRIPRDVIDLPRVGAINMHPPLLPRHRGPNSVGWAFRDDDAEIGFTAHRLDADFDTGAILAQSRIPILDDDDSASLTGKLGQLIVPLLGAALEQVARVSRVKRRMNLKQVTPGCSRTSGGRSIGAARRGRSTIRCGVGPDSATSPAARSARSTANRSDDQNPPAPRPIRGGDHPRDGAAARWRHAHRPVRRRPPRTDSWSQPMTEWSETNNTPRRRPLPHSFQSDRN